METTFTIKKDRLPDVPPEKFSFQSTFRALRHKNFAMLLFGQTLSRIGDFLFQIAMTWWVLEKQAPLPRWARSCSSAFCPR